MANLKAGTLIGGNLIWDAGNLPLRTTNNDLYIRTARVYTTEYKPTYADVGAVNKAGDTMTGNLAITHGNDASIWINAGTNKDTQLYFTEDGKNHGAYIRYAGAESENKTYFGTRQSGVEKHFMEIPRFGGVNFPITPTASSAPTSAGHLTRKDYVDQQVSTKVALGGSTMSGKLTLNYTSSVRVPVGNSSQRGDSARGDFRFNTDEISFEGHDGNEWQPIGSGRVAFTIHTANFTAVRGKGHLVDTRNSGIVVTLPSGVRNSDFVVIGDGSKNASKNPFWVAGFNGDRLLVDRDNCILRFGYFGNKWIIEDGVGETGAIDKGEYVARAGSTMTGDLYLTKKKVSISDAVGPSAQFEAVDGNTKGIFRTSVGDAILGTMVGTDWQGYIKVGPKSGFTYTPTGTEYKVFHQGFKPTAADVNATRADAYVGEGMRQLGGLESKVGDDYLYRYYKICELTDSRSLDTTFDIIVSADKNYAGSTGRYYVNVSRYSGSGDVQGSFHVTINRKHGGPDMIELAVKKETGKTTLWARAKRMWGNMAVQVINRAEDGGKPTWVADGTFVLSNDPILNGTVKMNCGNIYSGDDNAVIYTQNEFFSRVFDSGSRVYCPANKPTADDVGAAPAGYGLGGSAPKFHNRSGFFANASSGEAGYPGNGAGFQSTYNTNRRAQIYMTTGGDVYSRFSLSEGVVDSSTAWAVHYTTLNKPTPAVLGAVSLTADNGMSGILRIKNIADNTIPAADEVKYDGYGMIGNRGTVYLTNASTASNSQVQICIGGRHADNAKFMVYSDKVNTNVDLQERGKRVYSENNKPSAATIGALPLAGGTISGDLKVGSGKFYIDSVQLVGLNSNELRIGDTTRERFIRLEGKDFVVRPAAGVDHRIYHQGFKPTAADVGALPVDSAGYVTTAIETRAERVSMVSDNAAQHFWFKNSVGNERALIWHDSNNNLLQMRVGGASRWVSVDVNGAFSSHNIAGEQGCFWARTAPSGAGGGIIRGDAQAGSWTGWRDRSSAVQLDCANVDAGAVNVWKATKWAAWHVAAMDVHVPGNIAEAQVSMHIGQNNNQFAFKANGQGFASAGWHTGSDSRFKENIKPISSARTSWLDKVCSLNASSFKYKISDKQSIGFIAQDVQKAIPEAISVQIDTTIPEAEREGTERLFIDPMAIIAAQNEAIKELRARLEALENK